ncbi:MAG: hypothetical protein FJX75_26440 [Armatimonadetes bacterium]|nr:hypothetical protein [Armatimonadota bacterium]
MASAEALAPLAEPKPLAPSRLESVVVFVLAAAFVALVGALAVTQNAVDWRALAAVSHAVDVLRQEDSVNLALIGFVEPPLPSLLQLPFAWLMPGLASAGQTVWMLGAIVAGLTLYMLNAACAYLGLGRAFRWAFCTLVLLNPVFLGLMATGVPDGLYVFLLLGAGWALLRWQHREALRDLIGCSLFLGLATITRYDALIPVIVATLVITTQTLRTAGRWSKLEGTLITFLLPIVYIAGLWVLANLLIMGDAWYFWRAAWRAEPTLFGQVTAQQAVVGSVLALAPLLAATWWAFWGGASGRPRLAAGPALMLLSPAAAVLVAPGWFRPWLARAAETDLPLLPAPDLFAPLLAATLLLSAAALGDVVPLFSRKSYAKEVCLAGGAVLLAVGCLFTLGGEERIYVDPRPAFVGLPFGADNASATKAVAARLQAEDPKGTLIVAGWPGYAVTLYAGRAKDKVLFPDASPPADVGGLHADGGLLVRYELSILEAGVARDKWEKALGVRLTYDDWWGGGWMHYRMEESP